MENNAGRSKWPKIDGVSISWNFLDETVSLLKFCVERPNLSADSITTVFLALVYVPSLSLFFLDIYGVNLNDFVAERDPHRMDCLEDGNLNVDPAEGRLFDTFLPSTNDARPKASS
jgi:hypothetical protein